MLKFEKLPRAYRTDGNRIYYCVYTMNFFCRICSDTKFPRLLSNMQFSKVNLQCLSACRLFVALVMQTNRLNLHYCLYFCNQPINTHYYSFKIFPRFWLAKSTRLIHHNQLLTTKFGRILCLMRKWRQKCSVLAG